MAPLHLMEYPTDAHLYSFKWKKFHFSIAKAVLPTTLLSLNRTIPSSCKVQKSNYVWPHILMLPFFIYFTWYVIVHNFCNLFLSLLHKPSSSPFVMPFRRYHWCIYALAHMYSCKQKEFLNFFRTWTLLSVCALFKAFLVQRASFIWWSVNVHQCPTATSGIWIYHNFKGNVAVRFERKLLALPKVGDLTYNIIALCFCVVWVLEIYKIILDWCFFAVMGSF